MGFPIKLLLWWYSHFLRPWAAAAYSIVLSNVLPRFHTVLSFNIISSIMGSCTRPRRFSFACTGFIPLNACSTSGMSQILGSGAPVILWRWRTANRYHFIDLCMRQSSARKAANRHSWCSSTGTADNFRVRQKFRYLHLAELYVRWVEGARPCKRYWSTISSSLMMSSLVWLLWASTIALLVLVLGYDFPAE